MKLPFLCSLMLLVSVTISAQDYFPKNDGVKSDKNTNYTVIKNAVIHTNPSTTLKNGMLLVKDGKIVSVGKSVNIPQNAVQVDAEGNHIYASFIDAYSSFGIDKPKRGSNNSNQPQYDASREGYYWNDHIRPETNAVEHFKYNTKDAKELQDAGFGVVNTHVPDAIIRGTGMLVALNDEGTQNDRLLVDKSAQFLSFDKSVTSRQSYPTSIMGAMALLRQVYLDAQWYQNGNATTKDLALEALNNNKNLPQIFLAEGYLNDLRADKVGDESGVNYIIVGGGDEYKSIEAIKNTNAKYILPINFKDAYDVEDPYLAGMVDLESMKEWNQQPSNPKWLAENNVMFAFTTHDLKSPKEFHKNLMMAIKRGLSKEKALEALTTIPAQMLGQSGKLGELKQGAHANFIITSGELFEEDTKIFENWVQGQKHVVNKMQVNDINGDYNLTIDNTSYKLTISGTSEKPKAKVTTGDKKLGAKLTFANDWMTLVLTSPDENKKEYTRLIASVPRNPNSISGKAILYDGSEARFTATKTATTSQDEKEDDKDDEDDSKEEEFAVMPLTYPNTAYGFSEQPKQQDILFKNVTVWTNEDQGILEQTDVLIKDGKIAKIGNNLSAGRAIEVDGTGKHLTSGIIDEHSHIAGTAINEAGHNSTAEVNMEDVVDPSDIDIYRNLAGGVTSIQLLHGSANPIGGRSAILKLKWGETPDAMIYDNSPKFIKFALGENVKQSNWGSRSRFPQTRMGVEQVFVDYFTRAKQYEKDKASGNYRKDLEMETILEILNGERFISCHSYVQSEINMLMKVAEQFDFNINTFTHILEGYKVADKMAEHGVAGSTFSDWWAYKYEVNDAIPYNASIMHNAGVLVAINSDDGEMSRRLNQEAAKTVKYGGMSEEEAWKFVTLNPAKMLHIDDRVGSIKVGKDADVVLWSGHPMSIYSKAEKTIIEGKVYFDIEEDKALRKENQRLRNVITTQMLQAKNKGLKTQPVKKKEEQHMHCDTLEVFED